jgi:regulatory protein
MSLRRPRKLSHDELKDYAARLLGVRALSVAQLKDKLRRRAQNAADVDAVVGLLKDLAVLSDRRFAEHFAAARAGAKSVGRQRVLADLLKKRVAPKVAEKAVSEAYQDFDEAAAIEDWLSRKYRSQNLGELLQDPARLASAYRRLRTAGFSSAASIRVLKRFAAAAEQLEDTE